MGCVNSKTEHQTTVDHCRTRCRLIDEAVYYRYMMADAHRDYATSLGALGSSLDAFLNPIVSDREAPALSNRNILRSGRSSHVQFNSGRSTPSSSVRHSDVVINYSKHHPSQPVLVSSQRPTEPPSVSIEQRRINPEKPTALQNNYNYSPYQEPQPAPAQTPNYAPNYPNPPANYGMPASMSSFFNFNFSMPSTSSNRISEPSPTWRKEPSITAPNIDPPSPDSSPWDFLNPFGSYDHSYYYNYMPNTSFRKVREEEGIPELEEVKDESEYAISAPASRRIERLKVDDPDADRNFLNSVSARHSSAGERSVRFSFRREFQPAEAAGREAEDADRNMNSVSARGSSVGERSVRFSFRREFQSREAAREAEEESVPLPRIFRNDLEAVSEIRRQFERAADVARAVAQLLEAGKRPYHFKNSIRRVAGRLCCGIPSIPNSIDDESNYEEFNATRNRSSLLITLQKLHMWESKLLQEVENEEILRADYERKCDAYNRSDHRGTDTEKLEEVRSSITKLSTRIRITLQILRSISNKISEIRDQELWPQICELVQEMMKMWEIMLECHQTQLQAILQVKALDSIFLSGTNLGILQLESTKRLQLDLLVWHNRFVAWIHAQKSFVQSLNNWLKTGLNYEPEITEDGEVPFSPGRLGLAPVFVILNNWSDIIVNYIQEGNAVEAVEAISSLYNVIVQLREKQKLETHQVLTADKDLKAIREMDRAERSLRKELGAEKRKLKSLLGQNSAHLSRIGMSSGSGPDTISLKSNLRRVFESIERFASDNARAYEELHMHSEED